MFLYTIFVYITNENQEPLCLGENNLRQTAAN